MKINLHSFPSLILCGAALAILCGCASDLSTEFRPYNIYGNNMVVQADKPIIVRGTSEPNKRIRVRFGKQKTEAKADANGEWKAELPAMKSGGPYTLTMTGKDDKEIALHNVMVGEVWICAGQSNMEMPLAECFNASEELKHAGQYSHLRLFRVGKTERLDGPCKNAVGSGWLPASHTVARQFSGVGYLFGKQLYHDLKTPVGIIQIAWGGSPILPFMDRASIEKAGRTKTVEQIDANRKIGADVAKQYNDAYQAYLKKLYDWEDSFRTNGEYLKRKSARWCEADIDKSEWKTCFFPGEIADAGACDGVFWVSRPVYVPYFYKDVKLTLFLGAVDDTDEVWVNGVKIGQTTLRDNPESWKAARSYTIPAGIVKAGQNIVSIRICDYKFGAGIFGDMYIEPDGQAKRRMSLAGEWHLRKESELPVNFPPRPTPPPLPRSGQPESRFNAMIAPWTAMPVRGVVWYQGESDFRTPQDYKTLLSAMIGGWRSAWNDPDLAFLLVQIAPFDYKNWGKWPKSVAEYDKIPPAERCLCSEFREVQESVALKTPNTGYAVTLDCGDYKNIHPVNKYPVAKRLALEARRLCYGEQGLLSRGPILRDFSIEGSSVRLRFDNVGTGLDGRVGPLKGFEICGSDGKFHRASAKIEIDDSLLISSPEVTAPVHVRYAWTEFPAGANFRNREGFPAGPFRTESLIRPAPAKKTK